MEDLAAATRHLKSWREVVKKTLEVDDPPFQSREKELEQLFLSYADVGEEMHKGKCDLI